MEEIKNVLVLGTTTARVSQFCKLFEAYLSHDSYEDALKWTPKLNEDDGIERSIIFFDNIRLICTPNLEGSHISKQILSMLSNFEEEQSLSAIIILRNPSQDDDIHIGKLRRHLFHNLEQFSDNIIYVNVLENDLCKYEQILREKYNMIKKQVYNFNGNTFFNVTAENWLDCVNFCKKIKNYIIGNESNCGLETIYVNSKISDELLSNLINDLTELLILIYICNDVKHKDVKSVVAFKRNINVCHGDACIQKIQLHKPLSNNKYRYVYMKVPNICHSSCNCLVDNTNVTNCMVFDPVNKTCKECKCRPEFHSRNYFKTSIATTDFNVPQINQEMDMVINVLATYYVYKTISFEGHIDTIFNKFLDLTHANTKLSFDQFHKEFNQKVKKLKSTRTIINDVVVCINNLYGIKDGATIISKFIEEIFPKDFRFEIVANVSSAQNKMATMSKASGAGEKMVVPTLKKRGDELESTTIKKMKQ